MVWMMGLCVATDGNINKWPLLENSMFIPQKMKNESPYAELASITFLMEWSMLKILCTPMFIATPL